MQGGKRNGSEKGEEGGKRYREGREEKGKREEVNVIVLFVLRLSVRSSVDCPWDHKAMTSSCTPLQKRTDTHTQREK